MNIHRLNPFHKCDEFYSIQNYVWVCVKCHKIYDEVTTSKYGEYLATKKVKVSRKQEKYYKNKEYYKKFLKTKQFK